MTWARGDLVYCSNVHPGSDPAAIAAQLAGPIAGVRAHRGLARMGCGLWLPARAARILVDDPERLRRLLDQNGLYLFTLNGFPQGDFHARRVKENVYTPAWDEPRRLDYTLDLAQLLSHCLPPDQAEGTISSVPLGFAPAWNAARHARALDHLCVAARALANLRDRAKRHIRLCLEPEPGCVLETTDQVIALFARDLPMAAARAGVPERLLQDHLGICCDLCHQAVLFEEPARSLARLQAAGVPVGKVQISSALEVPVPAHVDLNTLLAEFAEPKYLHQVRTRTRAGEVTGVMDLPQALALGGANPALPRHDPWRIHFHVPIQTGPLVAGALGTTRGTIPPVLDLFTAEPSFRPHLEVETYTWNVLPSDHRPRNGLALEFGLTAELAWLEAGMADRGLLAREAA